MQSGITYGGLGDWGMTFQFNNENDRGFWWGDTGHSTAQGAMVLTTNGKLTVAHSLRVGHGESDTTTPGATYRLDVSGSIYASGNVTAYSDARVKDEVETISNAVEKVQDLRGVSYVRNDLEEDDVSYQKRQMGVIAQEVQKVIPEVVTYSEHDDKYSVAYGNMVGLLIEAIKEQQEMINRQQDDINNLKQQIKDLQK